MNIADRIQILRKSKGISQEELADKIGVSRQAVSKWESEQSTPDIEKIILLSEYFGVTCVGPHSFFKESCVWNWNPEETWDEDYCFVEMGI